MKPLNPTELPTLDAHSLQGRMGERSLTAVDLLTSCLTQIKTHDDRLRAIISVAPRDLLLKRAQQLDQERASGHVRSDLHGIPILVKVGNLCVYAKRCLNKAGCNRNRSRIRPEDDRGESSFARLPT